MKLLTLLAAGLIVVPALADSEVKAKAKEIWQGTKKVTKKTVKVVKEVGKEVGKEVQEIFDPEDEDLQKTRKKK